MGAAAVPIAIAVAGASVNEYNTRRTARKQDEDIARGIMKTSATQREANQKINQNLDKLSESTSEPFKETLEGQFIDRVNKARTQALSGLNTPGGVSDAFTDSAADAKTGAIDYAGLISSLLAGVDASGNQRQAENADFGNLGEDLNILGRNADQDSFIAQLRASRHRNNPYLSVLGAGLSGAATGDGFGGVADQIERAERSPGLPPIGF